MHSDLHLEPSNGFRNYPLVLVPLASGLGLSTAAGSGWPLASGVALAAVCAAALFNDIRERAAWRSAARSAGRTARTTPGQLDRRDTTRHSRVAANSSLRRADGFDDELMAAKPLTE